MSTPVRLWLAAWVVGSLVGPTTAVSGQDSPTYASPAAEAVHRAAMEHRERREDDLVQYTAVVRQRVGAALRMPLKDRTLYRSESASRIFWWRDGRTLVQVLALREQNPMGVVSQATRPGLADQPFDPLNDALFFGLVEPDRDEGRPDPDDFWFEHPLVPEYTDHYRFSVGDTLRLTLPDGRSLDAVELQVVPTQADVHRMTGSLWIESRTGALVRAVYRLSETFDAFRDVPDLQEEEEEDLKHVPGLLKPWTFEISVIAVEYGLWDFQVWLPRSLRAEGVARAGILTAPGALDLTYEMESVVTQAQLDEARGDREAVAALEPDLPGADDEDTPYVLDAGWTRRQSARGRRTVRYLVPEDPTVLRTDNRLPPPIWEDAPGFITEEELHDFTDVLQSLPDPPGPSGTPSTFRWGLQRPDLVRYNRVEGLSLGARGQLYPRSPLGRLSLTATGRLGVGDWEPNLAVALYREDLKRRVTVRGYRELAAVDEAARHLGLGNSLTALLLGRDDGDYYRRTGGSLSWEPPSSQRRTFHAQLYGEWHEAVERNVRFSLRHLGDGDWDFRPNIRADEGWDVGVAAEVSPWWGSDPRSVQGGVTLGGRWAVADGSYQVATGGVAVAIPLPGAFRVAGEVAGGTSWGSVPTQRRFFMGGAATLRGYEPVALSGTSFARTRGEVARQFAFGAVTAFADGAWAGNGEDFALDDALWSAGVGLSLVDGLIRVDAAWGLRDPQGFRLELYLDGIL